MRVAVLLLVACIATAGYADVFHSRNGGYYAVVTRQGGAGRFPEHNRWSAAIYQKNGEEQYRLERQVPYDVQFPALYLSDDAGQAIVILSFDARVEFYDGRGDLLRELRTTSSAEPNHERIIKCSVAGNRAAFLVSSPDAPRAEVFVTGIDGREMWRQPLPGETAGEIFLSSDATVLLAGCYSSDREIVTSTSLFDRRGTLLRTIDFLFRYADIASERNMLALSDRNDIIVESLVGDAARTTWSTARREEIVTGIRIVDGYVAAAVESVDLMTGTPRYTGSTLVVLRRDASEVTRRVLGGSDTSPAFLKVDEAAVTISSGGREASVQREELRKSAY